MHEEDGIRDEYPDGLCPDCDTPIPEDAVEGDQCENCGHVFWFERDVDDYDPEDEPEHLPVDLFEDEW